MIDTSISIVKKSLTDKRIKTQTMPVDELISIARSALNAQDCIEKLSNKYAITIWQANGLYQRKCLKEFVTPRYYGMKRSQIKSEKIKEDLNAILEIMKNSDDISAKTAVDKLSDVLKLMDGVKQNDK